MFGSLPFVMSMKSFILVYKKVNLKHVIREVSFCVPYVQLGAASGEWLRSTDCSRSLQLQTRGEINNVERTASDFMYVTGY
jgi:hypothetical protein